MKLAVDTHYRKTTAVTAAVGFKNWDSPTPFSVYINRTAVTGDYIPGQFYRRELAPILSMLGQISWTPELVLIDVYVFLSSSNPGLGARLYHALDKKTPVIGVAKSAFWGNDMAREIIRGRSSNPLYITAIGIDIDIACAGIATMAGKFRIPSLIRQAHNLASGSV